MSVQVIALIVFFSLMIVVALMYRNSTLQKLPFLPGEEILFEEDKVSVTQGGSPSSALFKGCTVRVTTRRIIVAQKVPFRKAYHVLRHVISYGAINDDTQLDKTLVKGYLIFAQHLYNMKLEDKGEEVLIHIPIPESVLTKGQYIEFKTLKGAEFKKIFFP